MTCLSQEDNNSLAVARAIYNTRAKRRQENLAGRMPIQALLDELQRSQFERAVRCKSSGNVERLCFVHLDSTFLARRLNSVILVGLHRRNKQISNVIVACYRVTALHSSFTISIFSQW